MTYCPDMYKPTYDIDCIRSMNPTGSSEGIGGTSCPIVYVLVCLWGDLCSGIAVKPHLGGIHSC